jgi:ketosteroid isomerase-like protein
VSEVLRILERGYEMIWHENRIEDALRGLQPEFEWVVPGHPEGDVRRGPDGVTEFFLEWIEPFEDLEVDWDIHEVGPGRALALIDMHGRGRESGAPVEMQFAQLWTFSGRTAQRMVVYFDLDEARRDAGL